ncbi:MAG: efflux RND transporter periplasmic adaptor subunit [Clostridia bacterium]|nr:efflux RND transporter periplasmic adaptor subunit [Clostridia bacterium]
MRRKSYLLFVCLLTACMLSSCALLPQEEAVRTAPMVHAYERPAYETVTVERGDLIQTAKVSCSYVPVQSVSLSFSLDDEYIDRFMVSAGDSVSKGQLLAQLQLGDLETRIKNAENEIKVLQLQLEYEDQLYNLEQKRLAITTMQMDADQKREAIEKAQESYQSAVRALEDSLLLKQLSLDALVQELEQRQIRAPFAGTVTRVARFEEGDRSEFGISVITLVDSTRSIFRASTEYWDRFSEGDVCEINVLKNAYQAAVTTEAELGLEPQQRVEGKKSYVYFALMQPSFELKDGDNGTVTIVLDERLGVLHVPAKAVAMMDDQPIVYYLREDGMKACKPVQVGVTINGRTEILSGVEEGEQLVAQ